LLAPLVQGVPRSLLGSQHNNPSEDCQDWG
jgi:hypothetical protein